MKKKTLFITHAAVIAALYVVLTLISFLLGLDKGMIQLRFSEALTILPFFTPAAIPGLFIGCLLSNILFASLPTDIIFGSLATLIGAVLTRVIGRRVKWLSALPPILSNTIIVPFVLKYAYNLPDAIPFLALCVFIGELICCGVFGTFLLYYINPKIFR